MRTSKTNLSIRSATAMLAHLRSGAGTHGARTAPRRGVDRFEVCACGAAIYDDAADECGKCERAS